MGYIDADSPSTTPPTTDFPHTPERMRKPQASYARGSVETKYRGNGNNGQTRNYPAWHYYEHPLAVVAKNPLGFETF